jgi:hypothetical protein
VTEERIIANARAVLGEPAFAAAWARAAVVTPEAAVAQAFDEG